ncbi:peptidylprolyl isomerase [Sulfuriroseicoccus oceanibius]|uniref:peptidylprolyl isomerase n=1 Tax=Sulfuriroseicoccus oceanibius TaxID=2707525 RepID=A0A6B3LAB5_9BACT|nr:peptidylprolyl isomerase [Sulfuriroseicoccus oceanibius]QQL44791.1 peptidylprolyl isomerase [Sulfuriroseicoccus oceanibius]
MRFRPLSSILRCAAIATLALTASVSQAAPREINAVVAKVNDRIITKSELDLMVKGTEMSLRSQYRGEFLEEKLEEAREQVLEDLIDREVILHEFSKLGGQISRDYIDEEVKEVIKRDYDGDREKFFDYLKKVGVTNRKFRELTEKRLIVQAMRGRVTRDVKQPTPFEIQEEYERLAEQARKNGEVKISKIFIPRELPDSSPEDQFKLAQEIRKKLVAGEDFAQLARLYSRDSRASDGGVWPELPRAALKDEIAEAAFDTPVGKLSEIVTDDTGYHIIRVDERKDGAVPPLDLVRSRVTQQVEIRKRAEVYEQWIDNARSKAIIRRY